MDHLRGDRQRPRRRRPDFTGADNKLLKQQHGYLFEVPAAWGPGEHRKPVPIRSAGRFAHEAVDIDPETGILYQTEDNFAFPSGFYRYIAPQNPMRSASCATAASSRCSRSRASRTRVLDHGQTPGVTYGVEWVTIDEPDTDVPTGDDERPGDRVRREPGARQGRRDIQPPRGHLLRRRQDLPRLDAGRGHAGGRAAPAASATASGSCGSTTPRQETLTLLFESPSRTVLELPDNLCISPQNSLAALRGRAGRELPARRHPGRRDLRLRPQRDPAAHGRRVRRRDLHPRRQGPVRQHPGQLRRSRSRSGARGRRGRCRAATSRAPWTGPPRLAQGFHRFAHAQEDCRFERAERAAATNRQRNRGHGHVVGASQRL